MTPVPAQPPQELTAGRELDALVAEKVMGWRRSQTQFGEFLRDPDPDMIGVAPLFGNSRGDLPQYSLRIEDAWAVVERMVSLGFDVSIEREANITEVLFWKDAEPVAKEVTNDVPPTPPLALCLGALKAVEADAARAA